MITKTYDLDKRLILVDENENKQVVEDENDKGAVHRAYEDLKSLTNCKRCINCRRCHNCTDCRACVNCSGCQELYYERGLIVTVRSYADVGVKLIEAGYGLNDGGDFYKLMDNLPAETQTRCLLAALVRLTLKPPSTVDDTKLEIHSRYLKHYRDDDRQLADALRKETARVIKMCEGVPALLVSTEVLDVHERLEADLEWKHQQYELGDRGYQYYHKFREGLELVLKKLKTVRKVDDLIKFKEIGKVTIRKLKEQIEQKRKSKKEQ